MSKKLIAVASAAALALTALVAAPAVAAPAATITEFNSGAGTSASPYLIDVPSLNTLATGSNNVLVYTVSGMATGDVIRVTTTGAVKIVEDITGLGTAQVNVKVPNLGSQLFEDTTESDDDVVLYMYTTNTTAATAVLSVTRTGLSATSTLHIKGAVRTDSGYNLGDAQGVPSTLANGATATISFTATDILGNLVENDTTIVGVTGTSLGAVTWNSSTKRYESVLTSTSSTEFLYSLDINQSTIDGYSSAKDTLKGVVNNPAAATANAAATAQIAALTAQLAESRPKATSVTKKRFNTLARKWNAAFPSQKVALKK
jgi:hypothetical protein